MIPQNKAANEICVKSPLSGAVTGLEFDYSHVSSDNSMKLESYIIPSGGNLELTLHLQDV